MRKAICINALALGWLAMGSLCAAEPSASPSHPSVEQRRLAEVNRASWGIAPAMPAPSKNELLPPAAQAQIDVMRISREPLTQIVTDLDSLNKQAYQIEDRVQRDAALKARQQAINDLGREAVTRLLLRNLYSPDQIREQMSWFWFNQFNVVIHKSNIREMIGDYDNIIRNRSLGRFRDLLGATLHHPAMLRYLDADQNAIGHINENYAREIMELHTMGVGSGYSQQDVQELARILTGVGVHIGPEVPRLKPEWQPLYFRDGLFEFNPARHDFGDKHFLGHTIHGTGLTEVEAALDLIADHPATARHLSARIATYFMGDHPPQPVVDRMTATWTRSHGDISKVLATMTHSPEYTASLGHAFKDPMHYVISAVRLAYGAGADGHVILNVDPMLGWLRRMGEAPFEHDTPDGYPLDAAAWTGPGQMAVRFEIAKAIGGGSAGLFRPRGEGTVDRPAFPQLQNALWFGGLAHSVSPKTRAALDQATSPQEWNMLLLASPDFMRR